MTRILIATHNRNKLNEFQRIFNNENVTLVTLEDLHDQAEVIEDGSSFVDNAKLKASYFAMKHQMPTIADDSGLVVDALGGFPGVHSARYSGKGDEANNLKLLSELEDIDNRSAHFVAAIVFCRPNGECRTYEGMVNGEITRSLRGDQGFGYDPLFYVPKLKMTFGEATSDLKDRMSHRAIALSKLMEDLDALIDHE
ncbi:MAG: RdgB/HAM1 family non-canonical purine NTP pyrophosphatase [Acholeplasmataceae bacterium]|nr:RdgB/HAM1 family non-canonical purine NTP pyrophosphatase [Acholeplasmataceae bacterium]